MCAQIWLAADKHVYNFNQDIGFHVSSITNSDYWKDRMFDWGWKNVEAQLKRSAINDMILSFKYFDHKTYFGEFMQGVADDGNYAHLLFTPTKTQLARWEGAFLNAPAYVPDVFEPENKGWGIKTDSSGFWYKGNDPLYRVPVKFTPQTSTFDAVHAALYDEAGNVLIVGWDKEDVNYGYIYSENLIVNTVRSYDLYTAKKPAWLKLSDEAGTIVKWIPLT